MYIGILRSTVQGCSGKLLLLVLILVILARKVRYKGQMIKFSCAEREKCPPAYVKKIAKLENFLPSAIIYKQLIPPWHEYTQ